MTGNSFLVYNEVCEIHWWCFWREFHSFYGFLKIVIQEYLLFSLVLHSAPFTGSGPFAGRLVRVLHPELRTTCGIPASHSPLAGPIKLQCYFQWKISAWHMSLHAAFHDQGTVFQLLGLCAPCMTWLDGYECLSHFCYRDDHHSNPMYSMTAYLAGFNNTNGVLLRCWY